MDALQQRYGVPDSFFHRYFIRNAENRFVNDFKRFMLWREGSFLNPKDKLKHVRAFLTEELEQFYGQGQLHLPQIGFALTTRCTLLCKDCVALSPLFNNRAHTPPYEHVDLTIEHFRQELALLTAHAESIRRLFLHGGEPLLNSDLPDIIECSAADDKVELVEVITNGTIVPSDRLLEAVSRHKHKVYFAINNYSKNPELQGRLRYDAVIALLDAHGIKHPLYSELQWYSQEPLVCRNRTPEENRRVFDACWCKHSLQVMDGKLAICPRASVGLQLGLVNTPEGDFIDLQHSVGHDVRHELIAFYHKDAFAACGCCAPQGSVTEPALQMTR